MDTLLYSPVSGLNNSTVPEFSSNEPGTVQKLVPTIWFNSSLIFFERSVPSPYNLFLIAIVRLILT